MAECPRQPPFIEIEGVWSGSGAAIRRAMRILAALAALPLLTTFAPPSLYSGPVYPDRATIAFQAVPLDEDDPARRRLGSLSYLGGWAISSNDPRFGGISAIHIEDGMVLAVSDAGSLIRFSLPGAGPASIDVRPLPDGPGSAGSKLDRDAEAMTVHEGRAWIGFEQRNAVWRYRLGDWRSDVEGPVTVDNMEALDVTREGGKTIVWVASDDNLNALQRTLLLKFALDAK